MPEVSLVFVSVFFFDSLECMHFVDVTVRFFDVKTYIHFNCPTKTKQMQMQIANAKCIHFPLKIAPDDKKNSNAQHTARAA